jgi:hypothetical protein
VKENKKPAEMQKGAALSMNQSPLGKNCTYCSKPWFKRHKCPEFVAAKKQNAVNTPLNPAKVATLGLSPVRVRFEVPCD